MVTSLNNSVVVKVDGVSKRYRRYRAVENVSLEVHKGEIFGLIGPDGAGKSTLMKAIAGVLSYDEGIIRVFDVPVNSEASAELIKHRIGFMPQGLGLNLYAELSVEENIDFFARVRGVKGQELADRKKKLLAMTRLDRFTDRPMKYLSGGMKQKLGLICTLIHEPDLIILDEPTTGVDPVSRRDFWEILSELVYIRGITAVVSTAYLDEAERFQRLAFMYGGRILGSGDPETVLSFAPGKVVEVVTLDQMEALDRLRPLFPQVDSVGDRLRIFIDKAKDGVDPREQVIKALEGMKIDSVEETDPTLEDVFVSMLRLEQADRNDKSFDDKMAGSNAQTVKNSFNRFGETGTLHKEAVIEARELTKDFGTFRAVDKASFAVHQGEIFGLLGANGAGKTTLIKMLTGILPPTAGEGKVAGADMRRAGKAIKERIGYVSQSFSLYQDLTVAENIRLFSGIYGVTGQKAKNRIPEVIELTGLREYERDLAGKLPMGIRQRLALACAIVHSPKILFLDEPTSGVDPLGRRRFWDILTYLARIEGVAVLITTHYMSEAEHCDRLALMHAGRIVANDSPAALKDELRRREGELLVVYSRDPGKTIKILRPFYPKSTIFGDRIHLFARDVEREMERIKKLCNDFGPISVTLQTPTLEDVFVFRITELERGN
ncbi:MAG: ATP-binding cassette domain-containing protein [Thermodesulforhabdaceae bacterium]